MTLRQPRATQVSLLLLLVMLLIGGFVSTSLVSYYTSRASLRSSIIDTALPLTSDNVYSEIQKDLVRPVLISSMMARDTFVLDWLAAGEQDPAQMTRYLQEIMNNYGAVTAFFVSEKSRTYYQAKGVLKQIDENLPRDSWYAQTRNMTEPYKINVDIDMANADRMTFFINYKVFDYAHNFVGVTGVGLAVDAVVKLIDDYQQRYQRSIYFVDSNGRLTLTGAKGGPLGSTVGQSLRDVPGMHDLLAQLPKPQDGNFEYQLQGSGHYLNVRFIPELNAYLFVDENESDALSSIRTTLYLNLLISLMISAIVLTLVSIAMRRYQQRIVALATTDVLTELPNRRGFDLLASQALQEAKRNNSPLNALLIDIDHFKNLNDTYGHLAGDAVLRSFARHLRASMRQSDIICRWGGEEFIVLLKDTDNATAQLLAEKIRAQTELNRHPFAGVNLHANISLGLTELRQEDSLDSLIGRADRALYRAKESGRNRLCVDAGQPL
ncbi:MAG: sensor domain-containing diguanylate cyclase [Pseudomonas sp.]|uniref:sensor domain-containing diguanylate cyclase n=1 Tax=Pseudomonas sp. TaxID=306 RepID=UPI002732A782|nr:sensor domain-containing diguanylate cyclase [Pseudomonas sp.]MDP3846519.1 sensor domain-containing diguanylate cyclase [Pseudomonas sp.]